MNENTGVAGRLKDSLERLAAEIREWERLIKRMDEGALRHSGVVVPLNWVTRNEAAEKAGKTK